MPARSGLLLSVLALIAAAAQTGSQQQPQQDTPETVTKEEPATFKARVNLVMVPVVVRGRDGHAIGNLRQEDFQLFDKGKPQIITRFSVEKAGVAGGKQAGGKTGEKSAEDASARSDLPGRYVAYLFDDIHLSFEDMVRVTEAAGRHMDASLLPTDRAAIYSTSGQTSLEFTDDRDRLHGVLATLRPRPMSGQMGPECPEMSYYMADMILNHNDPMLLQALIRETIVCAHLDMTGGTQAVEGMVRAAASRVNTMGDHETRVTISVLRDVVRRMATMPGQRTIILASPGFVTPQQQQEKSEVMDRAIRANVIISSVDARGLYTDSTFDASRPNPSDLIAATTKMQYDRQSASAQADVLAEMAAGTGGTFIENTNDLEAGFNRVATAPEYVYLLGFSPQNLKLDGSFHGLKVSLKGPGLNVQARKGYYAPKHLDDAVETAKREIEEAVFSREELRELPIDLHSQFFKPNDQIARLSIMCHVDLKGLRFRKADGRNRNDLTIVAALFDRNGNYVVGRNTKVEMRLKDETLEARANTGFTIRSTFDVQPGTYMIRLVVRDDEGQLMSAQNGAIDIP